MTRQLVGQNRLRRIDSDLEDQSYRPCAGSCPAWFAPKLATDYAVWGYADDPTSSFRVLIDKKTGQLFIGDCQL